MSWLDWIIVILLATSILRGFHHGLIRALLGTLKYLISFVLILFFGPQMGDFLTKPWNLTQNIALSIQDMVNLPGNFYTEPIQISELSQKISEGVFPIEEFTSSLSYIISHLELPKTLQDILHSLFAKYSISEYLLQASPNFSNYPIGNMEELVFYTLASFIAKLIAISIGAAVILIIIFCMTRFMISFFEKVSAESSGLKWSNRCIGALYSGGIVFLVLIIFLELMTPLLCYMMIDPSKSLMFSVIMDTSFYIRPWIERALMNM